MQQSLNHGNARSISISLILLVDDSTPNDVGRGDIITCSPPWSSPTAAHALFPSQISSLSPVIETSVLAAPLPLLSSAMPSHQKESAGSTSPRRTYAEIMKAPPPKPVVGRVPSLARFFLVIFSSLAISSTLFTLTSSITLGELGRVSKHYEEWWEVGGLMGWKAVEVALAWVLGFDGKLLCT